MALDDALSGERSLGQAVDLCHTFARTDTLSQHVLSHMPAHTLRSIGGGRLVVWITARINSTQQRFMYRCPDVKCGDTSVLCLVCAKRLFSVKSSRMIGMKSYHQIQ